jgi:predicted RNase H-like HicB family nuclease
MLSSRPCCLVGRSRHLQFLVVMAKEAARFGPYVPDPFGCVAAAESEGEVRELVEGAVEVHVEGFRQSGEP